MPGRFKPVLDPGRKSGQAIVEYMLLTMVLALGAIGFSKFFLSNILQPGLSENGLPKNAQVVMSHEKPKN